MWPLERLGCLRGSLVREVVSSWVAVGVVLQGVPDALDITRWPAWNSGVLPVSESACGCPGLITGRKVECEANELLWTGCLCPLRVPMWKP